MKRRPQLTAEHLVLALISVSGSTAACATHGDKRTAAVLRRYYALVADRVTSAGGTVVKVMGDAALVTFPRSRAREAVETMRSVQSIATRVWRALDERCAVEVKVGAGPVMRGQFGPPGDDRFDVYGHVLNQLFKCRSGEFVLTAEVEALLREA